MELRSAGPRAASSMELVLTSTTHGSTSGKELVSSSEESRKSESALWELARRMENLETTFKEFAEKSSALLRFFATRKSNVKPKTVVQ